MDAGANVNTPRTPHGIVRLAMPDRVNILRVLIERGANINDIDEDVRFVRDRSPLNMAIHYFWNEEARILIENGAIIDDYILQTVIISANYNFIDYFISDPVWHERLRELETDIGDAYHDHDVDGNEAINIMKNKFRQLHIHDQPAIRRVRRY